jgi:uncharacterized membrane protein
MAKQKEMDHALERLVFFSDAVFAIAITLLVLEIKVPHLEHKEEAFGPALAGLFPQFFAFALSFLVIGRFWMSHHQLFDSVQSYSPKLLWPNLFYLMAIAFMPFATALLGDNLAMFGPALFYNVTLLVIGLLAWHLVRRVKKLGLSEVPLTGQQGGSLAVILGALISIALTWVSPPWSQTGMATIPLWIMLFNRKVAA